jgi:3-oxoacyl-[acyl-carrier-protein] synthase II
MSHTAAVNIGVFLGVTGPHHHHLQRLHRRQPGHRATPSRRSRAAGRWRCWPAAPRSLTPTDAAVFDTLFATSVRNDEPHLTPRPFDAEARRPGARRGRLHPGAGRAGACAGARRAHPGRDRGYGTNSDGTHVTQPNPRPWRRPCAWRWKKPGCRLRDRLRQRPRHRHRPRRRRRERGTLEVLGDRTPISSLKSYMGHTLGACGALEAWMTIEMMREGWFAPTINLETWIPLRAARLRARRRARLQPTCRPLSAGSTPGR